MTTMPYLDVDNLEAFELIVVHKVNNVQYIPWDKQLNSIRNIYGNLFVVEHEKNSFICFLCSALVEEYQLSKRLFTLLSSKSEQNISPNQQLSNDENISQIDDYNQFAFNIKSINLIKFSNDGDSSVTAQSTCLFESNVIMTIKLKNNLVYPLIFTVQPNKDSNPALVKLWEWMQMQLALKPSRYQQNTYIVDNLFSSLSPPTQNEHTRISFQKLDLFDIDKKTKDPFISKVLKFPQTTVLDELSKVTNLFRETIHHKADSSKGAKIYDASQIDAVKNFQIDWAQVKRDVDTFSDAVNDKSSLQNLKNSEQSTPLNINDIANIKSIDSLRTMVCKRGLSNDVRSKVWDIFTGFTSINMNEAEFKERIEVATDEYMIIRKQWESMLAVQIENNYTFRERQNQIDKDLHRIPSTFLEFPGRSKDEWLNFYRNILISYSLYNHNVGYSQAITDILIVLTYAYCCDSDENEPIAEAHLFGVLCCLMNIFFCDNFSEQHDQSQLLKRLNLLGNIVKFADVKLARYLDQNNSLSMFFCFRWLVVWFAREFPIEHLVRLWDSLLSRWPCKSNFDLLICFAWLEIQRDQLMADQRDFDGVLHFVNSLSSLRPDNCTTSLNKTNEIIHTAISIHKQLIQSPYISTDLKSTLQPL